MGKTPKLCWYAISFLVMIFITACSSSHVTSDSTELPTQDLAMAPSILATNTLSISTPIASPTHKPQLTTLTSIPTISVKSTFTPGSTKTTKQIPICSSNGIPANIPHDFSLPGTIIFQNNDRDRYHMMGGASLPQSKFPISESTDIINFGISPDGQWLAYSPITQYSIDPFIQGGVLVTGTIVFETPTIALLAATGERIEYAFAVTNLTYDGNAGYHWQLRRVLDFPDSYWINDHLLYLVLFFDDPTDPYTRGLTLPKIFDISTGKWSDETFNHMNRFDSGRVGFSPDMSRALFEAKSGDQYAGIVLQDLSRGVQVWTDPDFTFRVSSVIRWSLDSSWVAITDIELVPQIQPIFLVSRDGLVKKITDSTFPVSGPIDMQWSPDSQYLALVLPYRGLYLYNIITDQYFYSCPLVVFDEWLPEVIWSPDSSYIALSIEGNKFPLQIWKVKTGEIFDLVENAYAIGWSDKFPVEWPQP
jgi:hypothetical protein